MAKIGILTFSNTLNYGAALQCYALFTYLRNLGNEVSVIDYRNNRVEITGKRRFKSIKSFREFLLWIMTKKNFSARERLFDEFNKNYLVMTEQFDKNDFNIKSAQFDAIIVGSDQVWSNVITDGDITYFLPFNNDTKKISYAASFGKGIPEGKQWDIVFKYLSNFNAISVREKSAKNELENKIGIKSQVVCDPTFLLDYKSWSSIAAKGKGCEKGYVLCYILSQREKVISEGKKIAQQLRLPLVCIQTGSIHSTKDAVDVTCASPLDFLALFSNAGYVVTDSFHGTCFSILFQREFYSLLGASAGSNARIENLLDELGLSERYKTSLFEPIDYNRVNEKKTQMIKESYSFIEKALNTINT